MAHDLGFMPADIHRAYERDLIEVKKMMAGFNRRLAA
jgi:hypothetical protein